MQLQTKKFLLLLWLGLVGLGWPLKIGKRFDLLHKWSRVAFAPILVATMVASPTLANREVGNIPTSGLIFKDSMRINAFEDPKIEGITLYLSDFERPINEKLTNNFFNDPSSSSLTCVKAGPTIAKQSLSYSKEGEEVFEENRNLFFKVRIVSF